LASPFFTTTKFFARKFMEAQALISIINIQKNSLHFTELALHIGKLSQLRLSNRKISEETQISKTEVHRLIQISRFSDELREAAKKYNIEKYIFTDLLILNPKTKKEMEIRIKNGLVRTREQLRDCLNHLWKNK
jgi:hypothetical protein